MGLVAAFSLAFAATAAEVDANATIGFLLAHQKANGAFGPLDQTHTDLAWNYPAVHALRLLGQSIHRPEQAFRNGSRAAYLEEGSHHRTWSWDIYQRAQLARLLGQDNLAPHDLKAKWTLEYADRGGWYYPRIDARKLANRVAQFNDLSDLGYFTAAITLSGGTIENPEAARTFLMARQCRSGGFEDACRPEAPRDESAAHVVATSQAVLALRALGFDVPNAARCVDWLRSCQTAAGGFRWHPVNQAHSNQPDIWYTWCALQALKALDAHAADPAACLAWINSLQNADGGFGDRPGWRSRLYGTYYAIHALDILTANASGAIRKKEVQEDTTTIPEGAFSTFQAHLKSPPGGVEMVKAAAAMRLHFLGVKPNTPNGPKVSVEESRGHARRNQYPLEIVANPENYAHKLQWLGGHPAHHVSNWLVPPDMTPAERRRFEAADAAGRQGLPWARYQSEVIAPALEIGTLFYPEMDHSMMNAYMVYDDGLDGRPGYNAVIGALGWTPWDWIRMFPYRERWVGRLPIVADGDAHGDLQKWSERLDRQRVLYFAKTHDLKAFLDACRHHRTVCVIRRGAERAELVFYGAPAAVAYARRHLEQWKWWQ